MSEIIKKDCYGFHTRAVHIGNDVDKETGAVKRPITMANSYELPYDPTDMNWSSAEGNLYTRNGGANQKYLQERIASLEGGEDCIVLASGVAALSGLFFSLLQAGDHVVFSSVTYIACSTNCLTKSSALKQRSSIPRTWKRSRRRSVRIPSSSISKRQQSYNLRHGYPRACRYCARERCSALGGQYLCFSV